MKYLIILIGLISANAMASDLDSLNCKSIDVTHYPRFEIRVEKLASGEFAVLGTKLSRVDNTQFARSKFWGIAQLTDDLQLVWEEGALDLVELGDYGFRGEMSFHNEDRAYPYELSCQ